MAKVQPLPMTRSTHTQALAQQGALPVRWPARVRGPFRVRHDTAGAGTQIS